MKFFKKKPKRISIPTAFVEPKRKRILLIGPWFDISGYSQLMHMYYDTLSKNHDVKVYPIPWVNPTFRKECDTECFLTKQQRMDIAIMCTLPIEYKRLSDRIKSKRLGIKKFYGVTTLECSPWLPGWVEGCNSVNRLYVLSEFDKRNALFSGVRVPVEIGMPEIKFLPESKVGKNKEFTFLAMGQVVSNDRKNIKKLVQIFLNTFKGEDVCLMVKTYNRDNSLLDKQAVMGVIRDLCKDKGKLPRVEIYHGYMNEQQLADLYAKADCFITLSKGEGLCFPLLNAAQKEMPVIAPGFGGYMTYLSSDISKLLGYKAQRVNIEVPNVYNGGQMWCDVNAVEVAYQMRNVKDNHDEWWRRAVYQKDYMLDQLIKNEIKI